MEFGSKPNKAEPADRRSQVDSVDDELVEPFEPYMPQNRLRIELEHHYSHECVWRKPICCSMRATSCFERFMRQKVDTPQRDLAEHSRREKVQ